MLASAPVAAGLLLLASLAPFQCGGGEPDAANQIEETPGEALYQLAGEFQKADDQLGQVRVLKHLVARYPNSRFARIAEDDLRALGELPPE